MSGMGKPTADQETWVYRTATDTWQAGATGGGGGGSVQSAAVYYGYCTGSLIWNNPGTWANALSVPTNFNDVMQTGILRAGSVFTFVNTGIYNFRASFNAMAGAQGTYLAYRLSGSNGEVLERTTFSIDDQPVGILEGVLNVTTPGAQYVLQYLTSGSAGQTWSSSDPNGQGGDVNNMRTGEVSAFLLPQIATVVSPTFAAYDGYCTGSLTWSASGSWAPALGVPGNFTDTLQNGITRNGSTFTVTQTGVYQFHSFFNAIAGANGTYLAFRLSGSNGAVIDRTTYATNNPQPGILEGLFLANAGSSYTLQYLTSGAIEQTWSPSDPNGVGVDTANMRTGHITMFLVPSGSTVTTITSSLNITNNITNITSAVGGLGYPAANYQAITSSTGFYFDNTVQGFVPVTGVSASITTSGNPVLIMVNASWNAQTAGAQAYFSLTRDGVNLGSQYSGMMGAGPTAASYSNNASFAYVDYTAAPNTPHTYALVASGAVGQGYLGQWGVGPTAIFIWEMVNANVVTASTTLTQAVPGGNLTYLSASIVPVHGPVVCIASVNMSSDASGNWCWFDIFRNGSSLANGAGQGLSVNVGSAVNEIQGNCIFVMDSGPTLGSTNTYNLRATNGAGTNHVNTNNILSSLILWEPTDVNFKYSFSTSQITPATNPSYTDVDPQNPTAGLITRGRPVLLLANINSNTSGNGRNGYTFFRNSVNLTPSPKGMQLADGEGNSDWNKMPTLFWIDVPPAGTFNQYQAMGTVVSSSAFTAQGSYTYLFMYELDAGYRQGTYVGGWLDAGNKLITTASVQIGGNVAITGNLTVGGIISPSGTGSISLAYTSSPTSALNLSTLGVRDWFAPGGNSAQNYRGTSQGHGKVQGGYIHQTFDWITANQTPFTQGGFFSISSTASDDVTGVALSSVSTDQGYFANGTGTNGIGYRFRVPASTIQRTLTIYSEHWSSNVQLTVHTTDGSFADVIDNRDSGASATLNDQWTITYQTAHDGAELEVSVIMTSNHGAGTNPNVKFVAATLS